MKIALIIGPLILILIVFLLMQNGTIPSFGIFESDEGNIEYRTGEESNYESRQPDIGLYQKTQMKQIDPPALSLPAAPQD